MVTKTRIANKTIWALEDILAHCQNARRAWQQAMDRAERKMDPVTITALARLRDDLAEIERKARDARQGKYEENTTTD